MSSDIPGESDFDPAEPIETFKRLSAQFESVGSQEYKKFNEYYDGRHPVCTLTLSAPEEIRLFEAQVNWPRLIVDSIANRMSVQGFITSISDPNAEYPVDDMLWDWWQFGNMDKESRLAHVEALVQGRAYVVVNFAKGSEYPEFTIATADTVSVSYNSRTRAVENAVQIYEEDGDEQPKYGVLYDKSTIWYLKREAQFGEWELDPEQEPEHHNLGIVPVVPMINRARIADRTGRSEIEDIIPLTDFAARLMTNTQVAQEFLALPQRWAVGVARKDFVDASGNPTSAWQAYKGAFLALESKDAKMGQLPGADLRNFTEVFNMLARQVSSLSSLPPHALGLTTSNPASADAIRSGESSLVQRINDRCSAFEQAWEEAMRIALIWSEVPGAIEARIETTWANPETPTFSAKADAVAKLVQVEILPPLMALEELGYSPEKIKKAEELQSIRREQLGIGVSIDDLGKLGDDLSDTGDVPEAPERNPEGGGTAS